MVDAFGNACLAFWNGGHYDLSVVHQLEFDNGTRVRDELQTYFQSYADWSLGELNVFSRARGEVLDWGAGVGRYALELQQRGVTVTSVEMSRGAAQVARQRGLRSIHVMRAEDYVTSTRKKYSTVLMMGNNIGLLGRQDRVAGLLESLADAVNPGGLLLGSLGVPAVLPASVVRHNCESGRRSGEVRMRSVYRGEAGDWFDYLFMTSDSFEDCIEGGLWRLEETIEQNAFENLFCLRRV